MRDLDTQAQEQYERYFMPLLHPHQKLFVVPGFYGRNGSDYYDRRLVAKLEGYLQWAAEEPRIAGVAPWHWPDLPGCEPGQRLCALTSWPCVLAWGAQGADGSCACRGGASFPQLLAEVAKVVKALPPIPQ